MPRRTERDPGLVPPWSEPGVHALSRRAFLRGAALITASMASTSALVACGAPAATSQSANVSSAGAQSTLRCALDIPVQLDPANASSDSEIAILNAIYDFLVDIDHENKVQPRLATKWEVSDDGLHYTFSLTPNASFHDGSPLTAKDVVWTFDRLRDPVLKLPTSDLYANVEHITVMSDFQVQFTLKRTNPFFLYDLSDNHALVLKAGTADAATTFNGTGPFKVASYGPENRMELVANERYFVAGKPGIARLEFTFFKDQAAAVDALRGGQIDVVTRMSTPHFQILQQESGLDTYTVLTNAFDLIRLRSDRKPGNDPRVMQAFKLATDRTVIFNTVRLSLGAIGRDSPIGPLFKSYYNEATPIPARDPQAARALLTQAGYPNGLKLDLHTPDSGDRPDLAVVLKEQWAEAGIDVEVIVKPESVYYGDDGWLEVDLGITPWGSRPIPQFFLDTMLTSGAKWNESHFSDTEFDKLAETAGSTLDEQERVAAYREIQRILIERGPIILPYFFPQFGAIRHAFEGFQMKAFPGRTDLAAIRPVA